jgi:hypothetical protein
MAEGGTAYRDIFSAKYSIKLDHPTIVRLKESGIRRKGPKKTGQDRELGTSLVGTVCPTR